MARIGLELEEIPPLVARNQSVPAATNEWDLVIRPRHGWIALDLGDLWTYRGLLYFLAWRDLKLRYQQTALGVAWAVLQPLLMMAIFTVITSFASLPHGGVPRPLFLYCGILPWTLFAYVLSQSSNSLVGNAALISKVYFPRLIIPVASVLSGLVDFGIAFLILMGLMAFYGVVPTMAVVMLPAFLLLAVASALAVGIGLSALNVEFRDVKYAIPFVTQIWMYATPIIYPLHIFQSHPWAKLLFSLNPMAGVVDGFRWAVLGMGGFDPVSLIASSVVTVGGLIAGLVYFRRMERQFADVV